MVVPRALECVLSNCPFCHGEVDEVLVLHGGTCPHCFGEIPGEETPTDPGEEVKAQMDAELEARSRRKALIPLLGAAAVAVIAVGAAAYVALQPEAEAEPIVLEIDFLDGIDFDEYKEPEPEVADARPKPRRQPRGGTLESAMIGSSGKRSLDLGNPDIPSDDAVASAGGSRFRGSGASSDDAPAIRSIGTNDPGAVGGNAGDFMPQVAARRSAPLLESRADVEAAIIDLWRSRQARLVQCYERRLKGNPDLRGEWRLSFTVQTSGRFADVQVTPVKGSDAELESCVREQVQAWGIYGQLTQPTPIKLPLRFGS